MQASHLRKFRFPGLLACISLYGLAFVAYMQLHAARVSPSRRTASPVPYATTFRDVTVDKVALGRCYSGNGSDLHTIQASLQNRQVENLIPIVRALRLYKMAVLAERDPALISGLERALFPWTLNQTCGPLCMKQQWKGRGITLTVGKAQVKYLIPTLRAVRAIGCSLPITLMYLGSADLPSQYRALIQKNVQGITLVDMYTIYDDVRMSHAGAQIQSYCAKNFALWASPYKETIMFDADVLFFQDPETVFAFPGYAQTGSVFFPDVVESNWHEVPGLSLLAWMESFIAHVPDDFKQKSRFFTRKDALNHFDSSLMAYDKHRRFFSLLATVKVCERSIYENVISSRFHGDKVRSVRVGGKCVLTHLLFALQRKPTGSGLC
jgi:hypothetical protein